MATEGLASLPGHFERHLGEIARGWSDESQDFGIQVVCFDSQPESGIRTFATLGLSRYVLDLPSQRQVRQEVLMSANESFSADSIAALVMSVAEKVAERRKALLRGQVIGPHTPVIPGSTLTALYVTNPSPFEKSLMEFACESPAMVFAYLVPVTAKEASLIGDHGWRWFEDQLERRDPDIWDLSRTGEITLEN